MASYTATVKGTQKLYGFYGNGNGATYTITVTNGTGVMKKFDVIRRPIRGGIPNVVQTGYSGTAVTYTEPARFDFELEIWADVTTAGTFTATVTSSAGGDNIAMVTLVNDPLVGEVAISSGNSNPSVWLEGSGVAVYNSDSEKVLGMALRLRGPVAVPTVVETVPTALSSGNNFFIDGIGGSNANAGNTAALPWKDAWRLPGNPGVGANIYIAADATYEYAETWAAYKGNTLFSANSIGQWTGTAANPITFKPYYPRGVTSAKPKISWYALMQAADWTQEVGISGGKVWSADWSKSGNAYYNTCVAFGSARTMGVAYLQQNTSGVPASLNAANQYAVSTTKVYVYVPDGSNPNTYYGEVRIFGGNGMSPYRGYNGLTQNVRFFGIRFELCSPFELWATNTTNNADSLEVAYCDFVKCMPSSFNNSQNYASGGVESSLYFHDNYLEDTHSAVFKLSTATGNALNTTSWRIARNKVVRGNVSTCYGGAILYNQARGGTYHHAWGNYGFSVNTGYAGEQIDGCMLYADVLSQKSIFFGNVAEQSGKLFQANSSIGFVAVSNLAIDCGSLGSITNTTGDLKTPTAIAVHNTYLWTGRIAFSKLSVGPNIGGTGIASWALEPSLNCTNSQANTTGNTTYNFTNLVVANNAFINTSGTELTGKQAIRVPASWVTTLLVAGNATAGHSTLAVGDPQNAGTDYTKNAGYLALIGTSADGAAWVPNTLLGNARPALSSRLIGAGAALSQQYQDIGGRNFAAAPTIGCYEAQA